MDNAQVHIVSGLFLLLLIGFPVNKICSLLYHLFLHQVLSNIKEKLFWSQMEVQAKQEQLAEVEAIVARKREVLTTTKNELKGLQGDTQRLKESQGILGNRLLLRDFEDIVNACDHLDEQLQNLKRSRSELLDKMEQEPAGNLLT